MATVVTPDTASGAARRRPWPVEFYRSAVGKKWVMAVTGLIGLGFIVGHLIGNLKLYLSREEIDLYGEALRDFPRHLLPRTVFLWTLRIVLIVALVLHVHCAYALTRMNQKARPVRYQSKREYSVANYASRTMRWSGVIVLLFIGFHLLDLTWGGGGADFERGDPYNNAVRSFDRPLVAAVYVIANLALGLHLYHGAWSMFQSLGVNNPRINLARRRFAQGFAALIVIGNISFPIAVQAGFVDKACVGTPIEEPCDPSGFHF
jgi:succinate dehydrogenase / fumarate reductase, cytochrome b subunit